MVSWLKRLGRRRRGRPDPDAFLADLRRAVVGRRYTDIDRYRDFRAVFMGASTAEQGRRVLWQMLEWCRMYRPVAVQGDPHETYRRDGMRAIGLHVLMTLNAEPSPAGAEITTQNQPDEEQDDG